MSGAFWWYVTFDVRGEGLELEWFATRKRRHRLWLLRRGVCEEVDNGYRPAVPGFTC